MSGPAFKIPQGVPSWLLKVAEAANDNVATTAREAAEKRWVGQAVKDAAKSGIAAVGVEAGMVAIAVPAFLGTMGLAAYTYLADRTYYDTRRFVPCGTPPPRETVVQPQAPFKWKILPTPSLPASLSPKDKQLLRDYLQESPTTRVTQEIADLEIRAFQLEQLGMTAQARLLREKISGLEAQNQSASMSSPVLGHRLQMRSSSNASTAVVATNPSAELDRTSLQEAARDQLDGLSHHSLQPVHRLGHTASDLVAYIRHTWPNFITSSPMLLVPPVATAIASGAYLYQHVLERGGTLLEALVGGTVVGGIVGAAHLIGGALLFVSLAESHASDNWSAIADVVDLRARGSFQLARSLIAKRINFSGRQEYRRHVQFDIAVSQATLAMDAGDYAAAVALLRPVIDRLEKLDVKQYDAQFGATASSRDRLYPTYGVALLRNGSYVEASKILKKAADSNMSWFTDLKHDDIKILALTAARRSAQYLLYVTENDAEAIADSEIAALVDDAKIRMQAKEYGEAEDILLRASALAEERYNHTADEIALQLLGMTIESRNNVEGEKARKRGDAALIQEERSIRDTLSTLLNREEAAIRQKRNGLEFLLARAQLMIDHGRYLEALSILNGALHHRDIVIHRFDLREGINQYEYHAYLNDHERAEVWQMLGEVEFAAGKLDSARDNFAYAAEKFDHLGLVARAEESRRWQRTAAHRLGRLAMTPDVAALEQREAAEHMVRAVDLESKGLFGRANREYALALDIYEALGDESGMRDALAGQEEIAMALGDSITAFQVARFKMTIKQESK